MQDETQDPMHRGNEDMRGLIHTHGIDEAIRQVAWAASPPFDLSAEARLRGMIRAAYEAGQLDGITNKTERVY